MLAKWRSLFSRYIRDALAVWLGLRAPDVPFTAKLAGLASIVYLLLPTDIIPDIIPVLGQLDDIAVVPLAAHLAGKFIPPGTMSRLRDEADSILYRWGPRIAGAALVILVVWLILAAIGVYLLWTGHSDGARLGTALPAHLRGN